MAVSVDQLGKALLASGLMTADALKALWTDFAAGSEPHDAARFGQFLVERGKLTPFQAAQIVAGQTSQLIIGDYLLLAEIGAGGMGQVYKAQHRRMKRTVALKVMSAAAMRDDAAVKRFQREVQAAARLEHPNIVTAYASGEFGTVKYLVMQFVDGGDLAELVKKGGALAVERAVDYIVQAARGLAYAHAEGVIHRDIKPANLLLDKNGTVKILDMGLARIEGGDDNLTATEQVMGTVDYMSPEQASNTKGVDARADIYSLGCTLWFLLTAKKVYEADSMIGRLMAHREAPLPSLVKARDDVPWALEQALHKLIAKRPQDRHQSMDEVIETLEPFVGGGAASGGSRSNSSSGANAELASFMQAMGTAAKKPAAEVNSVTGAKSGTPSLQTKPESGSKTSLAGQLDATLQFDRAEAETDPEHALPSTKAAATSAASAGASSTSAPRAVVPRKRHNTQVVAGSVGVLAVVAAIGFAMRGTETQVAEQPVAAANSPPAPLALTSPSSTVIVAATASPPFPRPTGSSQQLTPQPVDDSSEVFSSPEYEWSDPENLGPSINGPANEGGGRITADGLYFMFSTASRSGIRLQGGQDILAATRRSVDQAWEPAKPVEELSTNIDDIIVHLAPDGLRAIVSQAPNGAQQAQARLLETVRPSRSSPWSLPVDMGPEVNSGGTNRMVMSRDALLVIVSSFRPGGLGNSDMWSHRRTAVDQPWGPGKHLGPSVNSPSGEGVFGLSDDGLVVFFNSTRSGGLGAFDVWMSRRPAIGAGWSAPINLGPTINGTASEFGNSLGHDGRTLYFSSAGPNSAQGDLDLWMSKRVPKRSAGIAPK